MENNEVANIHPTKGRVNARNEVTSIQNQIMRHVRYDAVPVCLWCGDSLPLSREDDWYCCDGCQICYEREYTKGGNQ